MKLFMTSPASSLAIAAGQNAGSAKRLRIIFMALAFCVIARSTRMRWVAKKFSTPCCTHPDNRDTKDESPVRIVEDSFSFLGMITSEIAAVQHQVERSILNRACQAV